MKTVAFDYMNQKWVYEGDAQRVRIAQIEEELSLLEGPRGNEYAKFIGLAGPVIAIAQLKVELAGLRGAL